jgi:N-acetylglutamate synthase-like GNAT family acetyltransferase
MIALAMKESLNSGRPDETGAASRSAIRAACSDDGPAIADVINLANKVFYKAIVPSDRYREPFLDLQDVRAESRRRTFYVFEKNDKIAGVIALEARLRAIGVIGRLYVLPNRQREGIGTALLSHVEGLAKRGGLRETVVWTDPKAIWAVSFYRRHGYHEIVPRTVFGDPTIDARAEQHPETLLVLRKSLL